MADLRDDPITEGTLDRHVHHPLATRLVGRVPRLPDTRGLLRATLLVGCTAVATLASAPRGLDWLYPAWLLFVFTVLSRACRQVAPTGRAGEPPLHGVPVLLDLAVGLAFWLVLTLRAAPFAPWTWLLVVPVALGALAQVGLHGQLRARFLAFTGAAERPADDTSVGVLGQLYRIGAAFAHDFGVLVLGPAPCGPLVPPAAARSLLAGPMRMAAHLGPGTHLALLYGATALAAIRPDLAFWTVVLGVAVLDVWALLVLSAWRRAETLVRDLAPA